MRATASEVLVTVSIQDFGPGISQEKQKQIFERFFRVEGPAQKSISGLGLGLFISNEIIKQLEGHMTVESTPAKVPRFSLLSRVQRQSKSRPGLQEREPS